MEALAKVREDMADMDIEIAEAKHMAATAQANVTAHEQLCAERYRNINEKMTAIPDIYKSLGVIKSLVYIGVGIWVGVPAVLGIIATIYKLTGH